MNRAVITSAVLSGIIGVALGTLFERSQAARREEAWRRSAFISIYQRGGPVPLAYLDPVTSIAFYLESNSTTVSAIKDGRVIWTVTPYGNEPPERRKIDGVGIANDRHDRVWVGGGSEGDRRQGYIEVQTGTFVSGGYP